jgi:putative flippase GtrA
MFYKRRYAFDFGYSTGDVDTNVLMISMCFQLVVEFVMNSIWFFYESKQLPILEYWPSLIEFRSIILYLLGASLLVFGGFSTYPKESNCTSENYCSCNYALVSQACG